MPNATSDETDASRKKFLSNSQHVNLQMDSPDPGGNGGTKVPMFIPERVRSLGFQDSQGMTSYGNLVVARDRAGILEN